MPSFVASITTFNLEAHPTVPITAVINTTRTPPSAVPEERNPLDAFFGYTLATSRTRESRHDLSIADALPPYVEDRPPTYTVMALEPVTLAKYLFKFGFLFPPFWIMGAWILCSPLHAPSIGSDVEVAWMADKSESERQHMIEEMRKAEVRWAWRCLWALLALVLLTTLGGITAWAVLRS